MFCLNNSFGILNLKKISTIHLGVKVYLLLLICFNQSERANMSHDVYLAPPQNPSPFPFITYIVAGIIAAIFLF